MLQLNLTPIEARLLGSLLEKERLTPETYPLSLNGLLTSCNQTTNREPVVAYDERMLEDALFTLREKKLAIMIHAAGARVPKYRHNLLNMFSLEPREVAVITVLLLRGPQTPGELRIRSERMYSFNTLEEVEQVLQELAKGNDPLVKVLPARPGQKERRFVELLSAEVATPEFTSGGLAPSESVVPIPSSPRVDALEQEVANLKGELQQLREEFAAFRKQFE